MAIGELYRRHGPELLGLARRITGSDADAEEALSDVFAALVEGRGRIQKGRDPRPYLRKAVTNRALNILRSRNRAPRSVPGEVLDARPGRASVECLRDGIAHLPERQAQAFTLRHLQQLPVAEIAEVMSVAPSTVRVHLHQAVRRLRVLFGAKEKNRA